MAVTRLSTSSPYARCDLCPGIAVIWADRAKHTVHLTTLVVDNGDGTITVPSVPKTGARS